MIVSAKYKNARISAQKCRLIAGQVKSMSIAGALDQLKFSQKKASNYVYETLASAISNAENNHQFDIDNLFVKEAYVGKSLVMKRFRPRAKGRASPIKKPFSRITIILEEKKEKKVNK